MNIYKISLKNLLLNGSDYLSFNNKSLISHLHTLKEAEPERFGCPKSGHLSHFFCEYPYTKDNKQATYENIMYTPCMHCRQTMLDKICNITTIKQDLHKLESSDAINHLKQEFQKSIGDNLHNQVFSYISNPFATENNARDQFLESYKAEQIFNQKKQDKINEELFAKMKQDANRSIDNGEEFDEEHEQSVITLIEDRNEDASSCRSNEKSIMKNNKHQPSYYLEQESQVKYIDDLQQDIIEIDAVSQKTQKQNNSKLQQDQQNDDDDIIPLLQPTSSDEVIDLSKYDIRTQNKNMLNSSYTGSRFKLIYNNIQQVVTNNKIFASLAVATVFGGCIWVINNRKSQSESDDIDQSVTTKKVQKTEKKSKNHVSSQYDVRNLSNIDNMTVKFE